LKTQKRDLFDIKTGKRQDEELEAGKKEGDMILTQILLFIVVAMMVVILYKLHSIKQHQSLKDVFIDNFTPSHGSPKMVNIPYEISKLRMELAPLFYLPMASEAKDLKNLETFVDDENRMRNQIYLRAEISEMEEHVKSHSPSEPFLASDSLKEALKQWAIAVTNRGRVDKLVQEYKQRLINVVSGNVFVEQAEKSLRKTPSFVPGWLIMDEDKPGVEELCKQRAENWKAGKWLEHLESLREFSKMKADSWE
jgi:hypothetical protein